MCFWKKHDSPILPATRRLLTFGKNIYGGGNDLRGCVNDSNNLSKKLKELYPDFIIQKYLNDEVTAERYKEEVSKAIATLNPGDTVLVMCDSCFSGTVTKALNLTGHPVKSKFFVPDLPHKHKIRMKMFRGKGDLKWILMSGSEDHQTSADCFEGGEYVGADTYFSIKAVKKGITYREWYERIRKYLPSPSYDQSPTLEGPDYLLDKKVFEGNTLVIHNSSHGSWTYDLNGDEEDGRDEGLYFDRLLLDDEINIILQQIPVNENKPVIPPPPKPPDHG
jgi:hypothetical protein